MILALLAAAAVAGEVAPTPGLVAPCIWTRLPDYKSQVLAAPDFRTFNTLRRAFSHVGIYVGNGKFIHSPKPGAEVRVEDMGVSYWAKRFDGARRVSPEDTQQQATAR